MQFKQLLIHHPWQKKMEWHSSYIDKFSAPSHGQSTEYAWSALPFQWKVIAQELPSNGTIPVGGRLTQTHQSVAKVFFTCTWDEQVSPHGRPRAGIQGEAWEESGLKGENWVGNSAISQLHTCHIRATDKHKGCLTTTKKCKLWHCSSRRPNNSRCRDATNYLM